MKKYILIILALLSSFHVAISQDLDDPFDYGTELLWAVSTNTRSGIIGGGIFRYATKLNDNTYRTLGLEVANVRHLQENRIRIQNYGSVIIYGKQNYLLAIRPQYGYDRLLFKKADQKGVQVNASLAAGPSLGWLIPYYVDVVSDGNQVTSLPYDPTNPALADPFLILGSSGPFKGLGDSKMRIGANLRASLLFEFGTFKANITGFEVGFLLEAYAGDVTLMPLADENPNFMPTAFLSIIFGNRR